MAAREAAPEVVPGVRLLSSPAVEAMQRHFKEVVAGVVAQPRTLAPVEAAQAAEAQEIPATPVMVVMVAMPVG
tara:strand:- start:148 stop:366 length:219 start_codon:yes stop_codon:yes gene_type:complete